MRRLQSGLMVLATIATLSCSRSGVGTNAAADASLDAALETITPSELKAHINFLADDLLEGRKPGSRGYDLAAAYVVAQWQALGLEPAGDGGGYLQRVPLLEATVGATVITLTGPGVPPIRLNEELFLAAANPLEASVQLTAPLVFVGFGVEAPEFGHNDYQGLDVQGKIAVVLHNAPKRFTSTTRAHYSTWSVKREAAARHGALGIIQIATPQLLKAYPWEQLAADAYRAVTWVDKNDRPARPSDGLKLTGWFNSAVVSRLLAGTDLHAEALFSRAERGEPVAGAELRVSLAADVTSVHRRYVSANVAAVYSGGDLRDEFVVYSAHLDHLGSGRPEAGDAIYNGAVDNASGVAGMVAVAKAYAALAERPRRSILFVAVTEEEAGLIGSDYFARNPTVPLDAMVANVNIDILPVLYDFADVVALGTDHSTMAASVQRAASRLGVNVVPDPMPEEGFFVRSDQYSFVKQGIPAIYTFEGLRAVDPAVEAKALMTGWIASRYHHASDDTAQPLNFEAAAKGTRMQFLIGHAVATDATRPRWNDGDFFGEKFGRSR